LNMDGAENRIAEERGGEKEQVGRVCRRITFILLKMYM